jgi:hypothetical protein
MSTHSGTQGNTPGLSLGRPEGEHRVKKQHARGENTFFPLEARYFSSSIRLASEEAVFRW